MGYTHYWRGSLDCSAEEWNEAIQEFKKVYKESGIPLGGGDGSGKPVLQVALEEFKGVKRQAYAQPSNRMDNDDKPEICFNGAGKDAYESFYVRRGQDEFGFTKTAYRKYDTLVCSMLIILKKHVPTLKVSSDGGEEDWKESIALCNKVLGYGFYPVYPDEQED